MSRFWSDVRDRFWVLPLVCAVAAIGLALALSWLDDRFGTAARLPFLFAGGPEGARSILSAIITSMISFTGLVFSITIVVLQLTSSQFSPRVLRTFLRDRINQLALGVFVATFVYALVVLTTVRGTSETEGFVPHLAMTAALGLVLTSVFVFLGYIHHISQSIRAATIISTIGEDTREALERYLPADVEPAAALPLPAQPVTLIQAQSPGVVQHVDDDALVSLAQDHGVAICLRRAVGEFLPAGAVLAAVFGDEAPSEDEVRGAIDMGAERSPGQDVGFGLRQLVDIAERALSPGINDPTTAVQVIDQLHDLLRRLATRPLPPWQRTGSDGNLIVHIPQPVFGDYLVLAVTEIAHWGADADRVQRRLWVMLEDLCRAARPEHRAAVVEALEDFAERSNRWQDDDDPPSDFALR